MAVCCSAQAGYLTGLLPGLLLTGAGTGLVFPAASVTAMSQAGHGTKASPLGC